MVESKKMMPRPELVAVSLELFSDLLLETTRILSEGSCANSSEVVITHGRFSNPNPTFGRQPSSWEG